MTKHHWKQQVKSFFETHVDQDKHEKLKEARKDMEEKKEKIIQLIKGEEQDGSNGKSDSLEEIVNDYHKEYESLYELYHNLTGELKKKVHGKNEEDNEKNSSSSSNSDSEVDHSSKGKNGKHGELQNYLNENGELKVKLENFGTLEVELNQRVEELTKEKDSVIRRAEEAEANVVELKDTVDGLKNEMKELRLDLDMVNNLKRETEEQNTIVLKKFEDIEKEAEILRGQKRELKEQLINKSNEASDQMKEVFDQLNSFQKELMTLATLKAEMETELERKSQEVSESLTQIGNLTEKLANSEADQKKILEEKNSSEEKAQTLESEVESLNNEKSQLESGSAELRSKIEELSRGNESNEQLIFELQTTIEDLKRDIEMDKDELTMIEEKNRNLEVMLRLSNQKLRVTEQLLTEKEAKNVALSKTLELYGDMIREFSEQANASVAGLERGVRERIDGDYGGGLAKSVFSFHEEVRSLKSWAVKVKEEGVVMRERIEGLEVEVKKGKVEKEEVVRMVKEKEERVLSLGEEKREAIKQLCVWIEYYRSRCVELRGMLLKMAPKVQRTR